MPEDDETPTVPAGDLPQVAEAAAEEPSPRPRQGEQQDPKDLARRLAEEAKKRLARAAPAEPEPEPTPPAPTPPMQAPKQEVAPMSEDPRELARRLAEEAKRRLHETPAPVPHRNEPPAPPPVPEPPAPPPRSLHERSAPSGGKMSAAEALAAAREAERRQREAPPPPAPEPEVRPAAARTMPPPDVTPAPAAPRSAPPSVPPSNLAAVVLELLPGASVEPPIPVTNVDVFRALWRAHRARALHENDLALVATASVLLDASERLAPGWLAAARVSFGGHAWAVWVDLERKALLGVAKPPEVYLAGL
jgi:hypothetical protein